MVKSGQVVSAKFVIPYPPGFPIMVPGQVITKETIDFMRKLDVKEIHGYQAALGLELIKPEKLVTEAGVDPGRTATIVAEPLERGFGLTLGNALRRVLLSSLQGAAVTSIKIDNVLHEFSSIPGVREDVVDIVLNIKAMAVKMQGDRPQRLYLRAVGPGEVTAGMIELPGDVQIMDAKHLICTLDDGASISMELMVATGKGYVPASANRPEDAQIGLIPVDSVFSPVKRVSYKIENSRVGQVTDYDRL